MKFKSVQHKFQIRQISANEFPCFIFVYDNWNDYGYYTLFNTFYYESKYNVPVEIGFIKILQKDTKKTSLKPDFEKLTSEFCSLGSSSKFYTNLFHLGREIALEFLKRVNDIAIDENVYNNFKEEEGFKNSLLRSVSSEFSLATVKQIINGTSPLYNHNFIFKLKIPNANGEHKIQFNFDPLENSKILPYRINCLIGKNATGKTLLLSNLCKYLCGNKVDDLTVKFPKGRPEFSNVIAVSFSLFDTFYRPETKEENSSQDRHFHYCGFHNQNGRLMTDKQIYSEFYIALEIIKKDENKKLLWTEILQKANKYININEILLNTKDNIFEYKFSSGQNIILFFLTHTIAYLEDKSIILYDEPELHLHPNAISKLITIIQELLDKTDSYAIISTHSPIIVQQIPRKFVHVINRLDNNLPAITLPIEETYGENLSAIDRDIFSNIDFDLFYKNNLKKLSIIYNHKSEYIEEKIFNGKLSLNACLYLENIENENN